MVQMLLIASKHYSMNTITKLVEVYQFTNG